MKEIVIDSQREDIFFQKRNEMVKLLDVLDRTKKHRKTSSIRQADTCLWLPATDAYKSWKKGDESFLWLQGKAGAGKTVLASAVIDDLSNGNFNGGPFLAYFYCDFRMMRSTSAVEVMRSILAQITDNLACLPGVKPDSERVIDELLKDYKSRPDPFYSPKGLAAYVSKVARLFPQKPFVVVDALDECKEVESLLDGLTMISGDVRVFATSRPLQNIVDTLSSFPCVSMDKNIELLVDIRLHITRELDTRSTLKMFDEKLKGEIQAELSAKADGMFRWVQCQIDTLEGCTSRSEIRRVLESLPEGLEETYRRILIAIDRRASDARMVRRALKWLVAALRPLRMSELLEGITIDPDYRMLVSEFKLVNGDDLLRACRSLVTYDHETDIITMSHMSVKEYLVGEHVITKLPVYHINLEYAHECLARLCMAYLAILLEDAEDPGYASFSSRLLLKYVLSDGFGHLGRLGPGRVNIFKDIESLQTVIHRYAWRWDLICKLVPSGPTGVPWPTSKHDFLLYTLIVFGSDPLFETFVHQTNLVPQEGTNPLVYAAHFNKLWHAKVLISHGAEVNRPGLIIDSHLNPGDDLDATRKAVALEVAVDLWHLELIDLFLAEGSDVPGTLLVRVLRHQPHDFPLSVIRRLLDTPEFLKLEAAPWDDQRLLGVLLDNAEDYEQVGSGEELQLVVKRLIAVGCGEALLLAAIEDGCIPVVRILLSTDALSGLGESSTWHPDSITSTISVDGDRPLHMAMKVPDEHRCFVITKLLVEAGCNPFDLDADDKLSIHAAVARGFASVVEYLLSQGVPLPSRILFTALQVMHLKRTQMICLLINNGARTCVLSPNGDTLLHVAMRSVNRPDFEEVVRILSCHPGCDLSVRNLSGETPLDIAAREGHISHYLLSFGTPSDLLALLDPDPSLQAVAFRSLLAVLLDGLVLPVEIEEVGLLERLRKLLDNQDRHLALAKKILANQINLTLDIPRLFESALRGGFHRTMEYLVSQKMAMPHNILFIALRHQVSMIPFLIDNGADLHAKEYDAHTLLHVARKTLGNAQRNRIMQVIISAGYLLSRFDDKDLVDYLISHNMPFPRNIIFFTLEKWDKEFHEMISTLSLLVSKGANVHAIEDHHRDAIVHQHFSKAEYLQPEVMKFLAEAGCSISVRNAAGELPIHTAVKVASPSLMEYLLSLLDASLPNDILLTWMKNARASPDDDQTWLNFQSILLLLISKRADVNVQDKNGDTPIHLVIHKLQSSWCQLKFPSYSEIEALKVTKLLVEAGCSISVRNTAGELPIHIAVKVTSLSLVEYLLSVDASLPSDIVLTWIENARASPDDQTWLNFQSILSLLISKRADVNVQDENGDTPIHLVIHKLNSWWPNFPSYSEIEALKVTKLLVKAGCSISVRNDVGELPIHIAVRVASPKLVEYLLSLGTPLPPDILYTWEKAWYAQSRSTIAGESTWQSIRSLLTSKRAIGEIPGSE